MPTTEEVVYEPVTCINEITTKKKNDSKFKLPFKVKPPTMPKIGALLPPDRTVIIIFNYFLIIK